MGDVPTKEEVREAYAAAMVAALAMTRSRPRAEELVQNAFEAVMTTRPWSRKDRTFKHHLVGATWSLTSHEHTSRRPRLEAEAAEGWYREEAGEVAPSPEKRTLERAEEEKKQADAEAELDALDASLGDNDLARRVLRCRREGELAKAAEIAAKLGVPAAAVYRANDVLKDRLTALRKRAKKDGDE